MIVVAIIGILAAIAIPNFTGFSDKARASEAKVNLGAFGRAAKVYHSEFSTYMCGWAADGTTNGAGATDCGWQVEAGARYSYQYMSDDERIAAGADPDVDGFCDPKNANIDDVDDHATEFAATACGLKGDGDTKDEWYIYHNINTGTVLSNSEWDG
jgi:type II secretory pathway pseudopilin PulG